MVPVPLPRRPSSRGIGLGIALKLASEGIDVALNGVRPEADAKETLAQIAARAYGNPLNFVWEALTTFPKSGWIPTFPQQLATAVITGFVLTAILLLRRKWAAGTFSIISLTVPLFAGMASTLRFTAAMAPLPILGSRLLARNWAITALVVLGFFVADYYVARAWIEGALSLV